MKNVNVKLFAVIYTLTKNLNKKLDEMKKAIIEGANLTFKDYANIKVVECTRKSWSKEAQAKADEYLTKLGYEKEETKYTRVEIDNIDNSTLETAENIFNMLENSNDNTIKKVASKVAKVK